MIAIGILLVVVAAAQAIIFEDVNILCVTDAHAWISRHQHPDHTPFLDADYGSIADAVVHVKRLAADAGKDVFFLNNGDHVEGSGLSDATVYTESKMHGSRLFPLIQMMPFDALDIGNHDLYNNNTIEFMVQSGFINSWGGHYLTSNTLNATTGDTIGSTHTILTGANSGVKLLVFGFLYHMTDSCTAVVVEDPTVTVKKAWFLQALSDALEQRVDAIIVLAHMDVKDPLVQVIIKGIRTSGDPRLVTIPVQFITGHTHYRGFAKVDAYSSSFEAGHYLDTLGFLSFTLPKNRPNSTSTYFFYKYIDANVASLQAFSGIAAEAFSTSLGKGITAAINSVVDDLKLSRVIGCPTTHYTGQALYDVYMQTVIPMALWSEGHATGTGNIPFHITSTGSLRYDVYDGVFTYNDVFAVAPFTNTFLYYPGITKSQVSQVMSILLGPKDIIRRESLRLLSPMDKLPAWVSGPSFDQIKDSDAVDFFFNNYDQPTVMKALATVLSISSDQVKANVKPFRDNKNAPDFMDTTLAWSAAAPLIWPCGNTTTKPTAADAGNGVDVVRGVVIGAVFVAVVVGAVILTSVIQSRRQGSLSSVSYRIVA